jgi:hypothetical protein
MDIKKKLFVIEEHYCEILEQIIAFTFNSVMIIKNYNFNAPNYRILLKYLILLKLQHFD